MVRSSQKVHSLYVFVDSILTLVTLHVCYALRYNEIQRIIHDLFLPKYPQHIFIFSLWIVAIVILFRRLNLYGTDRGLTYTREITKVFVGSVQAAVIVVAVIFFMQYKFFSRYVFVKSFVSLCIVLSVWRVIKRAILRKLISEGFHNVNVLIVGAGRTGRIILEEIKRNPHWGFNVVGFLDDGKDKDTDDGAILGKISNFVATVRRKFVDEVIITIPYRTVEVSELMKKIKKMRLGLRIVPENFEEPLPILNVDYLGITPLLTYKVRNRHPAEFALKRVFDFIFSLISLVLLLPLFLIIPILIKLNSSGSAFYIQKRVGFKGKHFNIYKFRSMVKDADRLKSKLFESNEVKDGIMFKIRRDPRVTSLGRFLRRYSLDELPQLYNVLKGDLSLVGPRPPTPNEVDKYDHEHMQRLSVRPGITGLSQVRGRSNLTFRNWVRWDLWYINKWSFWLDIRILFQTIPVVFRGNGAY